MSKHIFLLAFLCQLLLVSSVYAQEPPFQGDKLMAILGYEPEAPKVKELIDWMDGKWNYTQNELTSKEKGIILYFSQGYLSKIRLVRKGPYYPDFNSWAYEWPGKLKEEWIYGNMSQDGDLVYDKQYGKWITYNFPMNIEETSFEQYLLKVSFANASTEFHAVELSATSIKDLRKAIGKFLYEKGDPHPFEGQAWTDLLGKPLMGDYKLHLEGYLPHRVNHYYSDDDKGVTVKENPMGDFIYLITLINLGESGYSGFSKKLPFQLTFQSPLEEVLAKLGKDNYKKGHENWHFFNLSSSEGIPYTVRILYKTAEAKEIQNFVIEMDYVKFKEIMAKKAEEMAAGPTDEYCKEVKSLIQQIEQNMESLKGAHSTYESFLGGEVDVWQSTFLIEGTQGQIEAQSETIGGGHIVEYFLKSNLTEGQARELQKQYAAALRNCLSETKWESKTTTDIFNQPVTTFSQKEDNGLLYPEMLNIEVGIASQDSSFHVVLALRKPASGK